MKGIFVLIHGAWHGGWCWASVQQQLLAAGYEVFAPTLDGLSEKARPGGEFITIADHTEQIAKMFEREDWRDVVLVGHSYAGNILSLYADQLKARAASGDVLAGQRVKHYVFLDAIVPPPQTKQWRWSDSHSDQVRESRLAQIKQYQGMLPAPPVDAFNIARTDDAERVASLLTPMPGACYTEPIEFRFGGSRGLSRSYIAASAPAYTTLANVRERVQQESGWSYREIACGHDVMVDRPEELASMLIECMA